MRPVLVVVGATVMVASEGRGGTGARSRRAALRATPQAFSLAAWAAGTCAGGCAETAAAGARSRRTALIVAPLAITPAAGAPATRIDVSPWGGASHVVGTQPVDTDAGSRVGTAKAAGATAVAGGPPISAESSSMGDVAVEPAEGMNKTGRACAVAVGWDDVVSIRSRARWNTAPRALVPAADAVGAQLSTSSRM